MSPERLRDATLERLDAVLNGKFLDRACWTVLIVSVVYFGVGVARSELFAGLFGWR